MRRKATEHTVLEAYSSGCTCAILALPLPPVDEQTAIAAFLDRETAKIDALVAEQRRLIELLKEKRQAVISHAVTKGLNPHAPMKPSGIEWLGDVPAALGSQDVSTLVRPIEQGWSPQCEGSSLRDVTAMGRAESRLRESAEYFNQLREQVTAARLASEPLSSSDAR